MSLYVGAMRVQYREDFVLKEILRRRFIVATGGVMLYEFIPVNREDIISRTKERVRGGR
jgi:hypothetical protein